MFRRLACINVVGPQSTRKLEVSVSTNTVWFAFPLLENVSPVPMKCIRKYLERVMGSTFLSLELEFFRNIRVYCCPVL